MKAGFILVFTATFLSIIAGVAAVTFTASSDPATANAGQSNQLINFSVANTGSVNITQINITIPPGYTFTGSSGTTTTTSYTASSSVPSWTNTSTVGIVGNGATQYFWIYVSSPSTTGSGGFNITVRDANNVFTSSNVTFTLFDTLAPTYTSNTTSQSSNTTYATNQSYWFNITWSDGVGISTVLLEHNITGSGTPHNETMSNSSSVYYFNTTDVSAGTYMWRVYANDTNNTFNSTSQMTYLVAQASNILTVYLNGTKNANITSTNNTAVNVSVSASCIQPACTMTITRDNSVTLITGGSNPYTKSDDIITSIGLHNYSVTVAGNANYTTNTTRYAVATVPAYTATTANLPLTYSNTTFSNVNLTFDAGSALVSTTVQGDWSGTATNYSLSNSSLLTYYYNASFPAGTYNWKLFAVYANHSFNLTAVNTFTINKNAPTLLLNMTPQWTLDSPVQTNVSCTQNVAGLTANLYRNGTSVSNPDVQTFPAGSIYEYLCNNTVNTNYTNTQAKNTVVVKAKTASTLSFVQAPTLVEIAQGSSAIHEIKVKNTGNAGQNVTFEVEGIDKEWYSIDKTTVNINAGQNASFTVTFDIKNYDVKDYPSKFTVKNASTSVSQDFTLRVLPSDETKLKINDTLALYRLELSKLESRFEKIKANDTFGIEQKLLELKAAVNQVEGYINASNYFQAQQTFETIKGLITEVDNQLKSAEVPSEVNIPSGVWVVIIVAIALIVAGILAYLFWPVKKGYTPDTGYSYDVKRTGIISSLKGLLSKFRRKKKSEITIPEE